MAQSTSENTINWQEVGEETIARVRDLLRLDTRNPPGNEIRAAEYLHNLFEAEGISGEIVGSRTGEVDARPILRRYRRWFYLRARRA